MTDPKQRFDRLLHAMMPSDLDIWLKLVRADNMGRGVKLSADEVSDICELLHHASDELLMTRTELEVAVHAAVGKPIWRQ